ncbi:hypothetical protein Bbelb_413820 [Branchiostoma belcheri]|nr:hypothetical protein Bbelb_413820 [Branchiostoma belcheri]
MKGKNALEKIGPGRRATLIRFGGGKTTLLLRARWRVTVLGRGRTRWLKFVFKTGYMRLRSSMTLQWRLGTKMATAMEKDLFLRGSDYKPLGLNSPVAKPVMTGDFLKTQGSEEFVQKLVMTEDFGPMQTR